MKFQSEKKKLWRYASKNLTAPVRGTTRQQPLPHRLPHPRLPQLRERHPQLQQQQYHSHQQTQLVGCYDGYGESSTSTTTSTKRKEHVSTPPPPYSSVLELECSTTTDQDYRLMFRQHQTYSTDGETETSVSATDSDTGYARRPPPTQDLHNRDGYNYVNTGDIMHVDDYEKLNETSTSSSYQLTAELQKKPRRMSPEPLTTSKHSLITNPLATSPATTMTTTSTTSFAATAVKILRNCCGGGFGSSNSLTTNPTSSSSHNNNNTTTTSTTTTCNKLNYEQQQHSMMTSANPSSAVDNWCNYQPEQYFNSLMKQLKASQITSMLKAVESRYEQVPPTMPVTTFSSSSSSSRSSMTNYQTNCILIRRAEILGEEPYVIACRLFFWRDLKNSSQLKRLPVCPNERDPVYVCCNPLHWSRILETDTAPPPYQSQRMNQIEGGISQNGVNSTSFGSTDPDGISSIQKHNSDLYVRISESVTTDGEESRFSPKWCEVAYWEMAQRVGERYPAETPSINIFSEKPYTSTGDHKEGMCLKELSEKRTTPSPDDVQYTRQKIGLGVTLSQEIDGVWLYNRSTVPIFVYSPTLTESWFRVCRIEPGDCLRAFDKYRAQSLQYPAQFPGVQTGPIDKFSMRISFGKGWGVSYKRPDITLCPCWLEVLFKPQR